MKGVLKAFFVGFVIGLVLVLSIRVFGAEPGSDLPKLEPQSATGFVCHTIDHHTVPVALVFTYKDGSIVIFDDNHMHGFDWEQALVYANTAKQKMAYNVVCLPRGQNHESI